MQPSPIFEVPLVRACLRTLVFTSALEAVFYRLLTFPRGPTGSGWLSDLRESTGRAGALLFFLAFLILLPTLISIAYATLKHPAWPGALNGLVSVGLLSMAALSVSASIGPRGPAFALGFSALGLVLSLAMLAGFYERCTEIWARVFAVTLGGALVCLSVAESEGLAASVGLIPRLPRLIDASLSSGWWLLFASGATAFMAFSPEDSRGMGGRLATYGVSAATAFGLVLGVTFEPSLLSRLGQAIGVSHAGLLPAVLRTTSAAAALFLVGVTIIRGLGSRNLKPVSLGLLFLVLAGYPREVAYQHLLSVLGVILITGSAPPLPPRATAVLFASSPRSPSGTGSVVFRPSGRPPDPESPPPGDD